jgi:ADP-ribose pyrophosphatase YjhB (NUDIX family)
VFWDNPLPVVAAIVEMDGNVLLARNKEWPEKMFGLITGFLEKGETPETAVKREVKEELGLDAEIMEFVGVYSFFERNQLILAYHLSAAGEMKLGDELAEVKSIPVGKLKPWPFGTGHAVRDWLGRRNARR